MNTPILNAVGASYSRDTPSPPACAQSSNTAVGRSYVSGNTSLVFLQLKANISASFADLPQSSGGQWIARLFSDPCLSYPVPARLQESLRSVVAAVTNVRR